MSDYTLPELVVPTWISAALEAGAALGISLSGGKDGQALAKRLSAWHRERQYPGHIFAIHADLGRLEWPQTPGLVEQIAVENELPLVIVRRARGDLLDRWQERMEELRGTGKPFWSSSAARYCTSDLKRGPINACLRKFQLVISAEGIRAQESRDRAKKPVSRIREEITAKALRDLDPSDALALRSFRQRVAYDWYPLHGWSEEDIWRACGTSGADLARRRALYKAGQEAEALAGWPCHPAYVFGNQRLSCCLCVLASVNDLRNGARHNPEVYQELVSMELSSGFSFKKNLALADLFKEASK